MNARSESGFILLEVIVASAILAISLFAIIESLGRCLAAARSIQNYSVSGALLAQKSNEFRGERADDYADQDGEFEERPGFTWRRAFEQTDTEGLWKQTLTVMWQERGVPVEDAIVEYRYLPQKPR